MKTCLPGLLILWAVLASPDLCCADIVIRGGGNVFVVDGPDLEGLNGTSYSFEHRIANGTRWRDLVAASGFTAEVSSSTLTINGTAVTLDSNDTPLKIWHEGDGDFSLSVLTNVDDGMGFRFTAFGGNGLGFGSIGGHAYSILNDGDPVLPGHLSRDPLAYFNHFDFESPGNSTTTYGVLTYASEFSITGSTVPEPTSCGVAGLALLVAFASRRRRKQCASAC